jgi:hypothetical protein
MQRLSDPPDSSPDVPVEFDGRDDVPEDVAGEPDSDLLEEDDEPYALINAGTGADVAGDGAFSRRMFLHRSGVAAAALLVGSSAQLWLPTRRAAAHGTIETYPGVWGQRTVYEITGVQTPFDYRPSFHDRMGSWLEFWYNNTPSNFLKPMRIWTVGVHNDERVSESHNNGRGFDLTRIYATGFDDKLHRRFFGRYDIWKDWSGSSFKAARRKYWATSASVHHHFQDVLTYPYDSDHHSHIHLDNLVSGGGNSTFHTDSRAQVLHVQACCRFIWGKSTTIDGVWGPQTRRHSTEVLRRIGRSEGTIASSQANWLAFNRATLRKGYGVESY